MRAVFADPAREGFLEIREAPEPAAGPSGALVDVRAISINPGDVKIARMMAPGYRPGWDFAGVVSRAAPDGSGPAAGSRVVGFLHSGAWAERLVVPTRLLAEIPGGVSFEQAACLPTAGLTPLYALDRCGSLFGRRALVNGASGSVGWFALGVASLSGAETVAVVRRPERAEFARKAGAESVEVAADLTTLPKMPPVDVIFDAVGGASMGPLLPLLAESGTYIDISSAAGNESLVPDVLGALMRDVRISFFSLLTELRHRSATPGFTRLLRAMAAGRLAAPIEEVRPFADIAQAADKLMGRDVSGKIVLTL